ncbi:MAG: formate dehydrogenase subunit delta [Rhodanobacter sp.]|jgi:formate dehydrogenase subunit delta|nr:formate dehydrogenase subunit delta [Rhodanobacter sp.]
MTTQNHDSSAALVKMANDIADYFHSEPDRQIAVNGIASHIKRFWEPRMRKKILAYYAERKGEGLNELAHAAIAKLADEQRSAA